MENVHSDDRVKKVDVHNFVPRGFSVFKMAVFLKIRGAWEQRFVAREERDFWKIKCFLVLPRVILYLLRLKDFS